MNKHTFVVVQHFSFLKIELIHAAVQQEFETFDKVATDTDCSLIETLLKVNTQVSMILMNTIHTVTCQLYFRGLFLCLCSLINEYKMFHRLQTTNCY